MASNNDYQSEQIEATLIIKFICKFSLLEDTSKNIFAEAASESPKKELLYYYYGALQGSKGYLNYAGHTWEKPQLGKYKEDEKFSSFSFNQIVKIDEQEHIVSLFNFGLQSENTKMVEYPFHDMCKKLINMRNKIAHETTTLNFTDKEVVETVQLTKIITEPPVYLSGFDLNKLSDNAAQIYSNIHVIDRIMDYFKRGTHTNGS